MREPDPVPIDDWPDGENRGRPPAPDAMLELEVTGPVHYWRGPAPFHFVSVPEEASSAIHAIAAEVTYGWGCIPVRAEVGRTTFRTSLFPKDGRYEIPLKTHVRRAESIDLDDVVTVRLTLGR